jgi:hypothetical protein
MHMMQNLHATLSGFVHIATHALLEAERSLSHESTVVQLFSTIMQ